MKLPIPDDWNGEDWRCVTIHWPDSSHWFGLLVGFMTQCQRGRFWDEKTGSILDVQAIADQIWSKNYPFTTCSGDGVETKPDNDIIQFFAGSGETDREVLMSLCGYNPKAFRIVDGVLQVRDFCGEWVPIGAVGSTATTPVDDELEWPPESEFSACGKAWALTDLLQKVGNTIWDQRDNDPITGWTNVDMLYPNIMSMGYTINAIIAALDIEILQSASDGWYGPDLFDTSTWQAITCSLSAGFDDTGTLPDKDTLFQTIESKIDAQWPLDPLAQSFWWNVMKAIGENDLRNQGLGGARDTDRDCSCPDTDPTGPTDPTANGWYLSRVISKTETAGTAYNTKMCHKLLAEHDAYGCVFWVEATQWGKNIKRMNSASAGCTAYDLNAWGDTSDHLEWEASGHYWGNGETSVLDEILGVGGYTKQSCSYDSEIVATPGVLAGNILSHGYYYDDADEGEQFTVHLRLIYNTGSQSHS